MEEAVQQLRQLNRDVLAAAVFNAEGQPLGVSADSETTRDVLGSFVVALKNLADRSIAELGGGALRTLVLDGATGTLVVAAAGDDHMVAALLSEQCPLGAALSDVEQLARNVAKGAP